MDKYEYKVRSEEISNLINKEKYAEAAKIADTIDWRRVKSASMLLKIAALYRVNRRNEDSRAMLLLAYERYPTNRSVVYSLCEISIELDDVVAAIEYYKQFSKLAPKDNGVYILRYRILEISEASLEERIEILEEFKKRDYQEEWAYELAYLYHRVGLSTKCVEECDDIILWFGDGSYVMKAMELKMLHAPLTEIQQAKYNMMINNTEEGYENEENSDSVEYDTQVYYDNAQYTQQNTTDLSYDNAQYTQQEEYGNESNAAGNGSMSDPYPPEYVQNGYTQDLYADGMYTQNSGYDEAAYSQNNDYPVESYTQANMYGNQDPSYNEPVYDETYTQNQTYNNNIYENGTYNQNSPYDGQAYGNEGYVQNQDYNNQAYENEGYTQNQDYSNQAYENEGYTQNQDYNNQTYENGSYVQNQGYNNQAYENEGYVQNQDYNNQTYENESYVQNQGYNDQTYGNSVENFYGVEQGTQENYQDGYETQSYTQEGYVDDGYGNLSYIDSSYQSSGYTEEFYVEQIYDENGNPVYSSQSTNNYAYNNDRYGSDTTIAKTYETAPQTQSPPSSNSAAGDMSQYNTINLQKVVAESMKELFPDDDSFEEEREKFNVEEISKGGVTSDTIIYGSRTNSNKLADAHQEEIFAHTGKVAQMVKNVSTTVPEPNTGAIKKILIPGNDARYMKKDSDMDELRNITEQVVDEEHIRMEGNAENVYQDKNRINQNRLAQENITPATGQMRLEEVLEEWERKKIENARKYQEKIKQHVLTQTGKIFADFNNSIKNGILGELEREEEESKKKTQRKFLDADVTSDIPQKLTKDNSDDAFDVEFMSEKEKAEKIKEEQKAEYLSNLEKTVAKELGKNTQDISELNLGDSQTQFAEKIEEDKVLSEEPYQEDASINYEEIENNAHYEENESTQSNYEQTKQDFSSVQDQSLEDGYEESENEEYYNESETVINEQEYYKESNSSPNSYEEVGEEAYYQVNEDNANQYDESESKEYYQEEESKNTVYNEEEELDLNKTVRLQDYYENSMSENIYGDEAYSGKEDLLQESYQEEEQDLYDTESDVESYDRFQYHTQRAHYGEETQELDPEDVESIVEMAKEDALKTQEIKMNTADLSSLSEKIVATTKKEATGAKREELRDFTVEEQELFENFAVTKKIKKQIINALDNMTLAAYTGNVIITGDAGLDTVRMAKNLIKVYQEIDQSFSGKAAKITGEKLNQRNLKEIFAKLNNGGIIIEKANGMNEEKLYEMTLLLNQENLGIVVIMEDTKKEITKLLEKQAMIVDYFNIRIDLMEMDNNALVAYAKNYALALEYSIDELGILALYTRIANMQSGNHVVTKDEVRDIIDEAIWKSKKSKIKNFVDVLFARRYDNEDMIVLKERDFI